MTEDNFLALCKNGNTHQIIEAIGTEPHLMRILPIELETEEFLLGVISRRIGVFHMIPTHLRTQTLCRAAYELDPQTIRNIPTQFITEEMVYRAALLSGDLLSRLNADHFSERVIDVLIQSGHYNMVPESMQTLEGLLPSFQVTGVMPVHDFNEIRHYVDAIRNILENPEAFQVKPRAARSIQAWQDELIKICSSADPVNAAIHRVIDDFELTETRAVAFIHLKLYDPEEAAKHLSHEKLRHLALQYHGEQPLIEHAITKDRRYLIESSLDL